MFKNKYRIVVNNRGDYETQMRHWWLPFIWLELGYVNTYSSIDRAQDYIEYHKKKIVKVVKIRKRNPKEDLYVAVNNHVEFRLEDKGKCSAGCLFQSTTDYRCELFSKVTECKDRCDECLRIFK